MRRAVLAGLLAAGSLCSCQWWARHPPPLPLAQRPRTPIDLLKAEAVKALPLAKTPLAKKFLEAAPSLPHVAERTLYTNTDHAYFSEAQLGGAGELRRDLAPLPVDEEGYYSTNAKYGSPLAYARPIDLMGGWGYAPSQKLKVLDFGCGGVGQLRLLAQLGFDVTGVDVDPLLKALYSYPGDTGPVGPGTVSLIIGQYPRDPLIVKEVGEGFDLIIAKNTLKKGYIHPERAVDEHLLIRIGVDDATFLKTMYSALKPGGRLLIYNINPKLTPPNQPLIPWSDGRSPFSREQWELAHFNILALDTDDTGPMREYGKVWGWDQGRDPMDLDNDFYVLYTLVERPTGK